MIPRLEKDSPFPPVRRALRNPNGLLCAGADLSPNRLLMAYSRGIFPWFSEGDPVFWWSPDPRMVLMTAEFHASRRLARRVRSGDFEVRVDSAYGDVMRACAEPRDGQDGTWITADMITAYCELHRLGHAHSVECWREGRLVGGLYGLLIGRIFFGESMFAHESDASKVALAHLVERLCALNVPMIDCQQETGHLASLGARPVARSQFVALVAALVDEPTPSLTGT